MAGIIRRRRAANAVVLAALLLSGCAHLSGMHWPWAHKSAPAPVPVNELTETTDAGAAAAYPQYWKRNTLLVDLHEVTSDGSLTLKPRPGTQWPVRIAFRVTPGSIGVLEVRGEERMIIPVAQAGTTPVDLELTPDIYKVTTVQIKVRWSPR
jgi:hypothetical protein